MEGLEAILGGHFPFLSFQSLSDVRKAPKSAAKVPFEGNAVPFSIVSP